MNFLNSNKLDSIQIISDTCTDLLNLFYDDNFIKIIVEKDIDLSYNLLLDWLEKEQAGNLIKINENPFSRLYGITRANSYNLELTNIFDLNANNTNAVTCVLIDCLYEFKRKDEKINLVNICNKLCTSYLDFALIKELTFLAFINKKEKRNSDYPFNFYAFMITLKLLNDMCGRNIKNVNLGVVDYFYAFFNSDNDDLNANNNDSRYSVFYIDLYFCYIGIILFIQNNIQTFNNSNLFISVYSVPYNIELINDYTYNILEYGEFLEIIKPKYMEKNLNELSVFDLLSSMNISNLRLIMWSQEYHINDFNSLRFFLEKTYKLSLQNLEISLLVELVEDNNTNEILTSINGLKCNLKLDFVIFETKSLKMNHKRIVNIDIENLISRNNLKSLSLGGENIYLNLNQKILLKNKSKKYDLSKLYINNLIILNNLLYLNLFQNLCELTIQEISNSVINQFIEVIPKLKYLRNIEISILITSNTDHLKDVLKLFDNLSHIIYLKKLKISIKSTCEFIPKDVAVYFIYQIKSNPSLIYSSLLIQNWNFKRICFKNEINKCSEIIKSCLLSENNFLNFKKTLLENFSYNENNFLYIERSNINTENLVNEELKDIPISTLWDWKSFESLLYILFLSKNKKFPKLQKIKRKTILLNLFTFLSYKVNRVFCVDFIYLD